MRLALCPICGLTMRWDAATKLWDCGPEDEGGHGFWDPEHNTFNYEDDHDAQV